MRWHWLNFAVRLTRPAGSLGGPVTPVTPVTSVTLEAWVTGGISVTR